MLQEGGDDEEEKTSCRGTEEEDEFRGKREESFLEEDACNTEAEAAEHDERIANIQVKTTINVPENDNEDTAEHEDARSDVSSCKAFMEHDDRQNDSEKRFCFSDKLSIDRLCSFESHVPESEACDDESAEKKEGANLSHVKGKQLLEHREETIREEDEEHDGYFP